MLKDVSTLGIKPSSISAGSQPLYPLRSPLLLIFNVANPQPPCWLTGRQVPHSGAKSNVLDVLSLGAPSLCSATTVTTVFQQPIMSPVVPSLCPDPHAHPMAKRRIELEEVSPQT